MFDVDIDVRPKTDKEKYGIRASQIVANGDIGAHPSGVYMYVNIPVDPITGCSAIPYKEAEDDGFIKIDMLNNTTYDMFDSKEEILKLMNIEPDWDLLMDEKYLRELPHLANHYWAIEQLKPRSIEDLADALALIRPGKRHLLKDYLKNKDLTRQNLYRKSKDYMFKKSHAIAVATMIVCVMNKIATYEP